MAGLQGLTGGSLLAGWGLNNDNAPKASDNLAAAGMIRENNELARSGRDNVGLQTLQGLSGTFGGLKQYDQAQSQQQFQKEYATALQSGDRQQIRDLMGKYPQQLQAVQAGMKWNDDDHRAAIGDLASRGQIAAQMSPDTFKSWVGNNAQALNGVGVDPNQLLSMHQKDPQGTAQLISAFGMQALGPEEYWKAQDRFVGRGIEQQEANEKARSNQASENNTRRGQDLSHGAQMARLNHDKYVYKQSQAQIARAGAAADMDVYELNTKILSTGIDPLTGKAATSTRIKQAGKWKDGNDGYNDSLISGQRGIDKIDSLLDKASLDGVGRFAGRNWDVTTNADGLANRNVIEELKSGAFVQNVQVMRGMGALSNAEGQKLQNLIARLDYTQPENVVRSQLDEIKTQYSVLQKVSGREAESMGYSSSGYDTYLSGVQAKKEQSTGGNNQAPQQQATQSQQPTGGNYTSKSGIQFTVK